MENLTKRQQEVLQYCRYYKGESVCQNANATKFFGPIWSSERAMVKAACRLDTFSEKEAVSYVSAHLCTWMPYEKYEVLSEYLGHFPEYREWMMRVHC